jgi:phosphatidylglycerol:prolipoprotein diacylglycerol transferase
VAWLAIAWILWKLGTKALRMQRPTGEIFCWYLILTGVARFLVEIIRINPRSFYGMSNAQTASVVSVILGLGLLWRVKGRRKPAR